MISITLLQKTKIVVDTNIFISGAIWDSYPRKVLKFITEERCLLFYSNEQLAELKTVFSKKFNNKKTLLDQILILIHGAGKSVICTNRIQACRDPKDNYLLEVSENSDADYLITGDKDLLTMKLWGKTQIITPSEFINIMR